MVDQHANIMALMYIFAHSYTIRRKRRGIQPGEIKPNLALLITNGKVEFLTVGATYGMKDAGTGQMIFCF
jgi:hypothetical protein